MEIQGKKTPEPESGDVNMDMRIVFPAGKKVNAIYKGFTIETDQSKKNGGEESAPTPFDLFLASIGTCVGIYVLTFCNTRNIPTEKLELSMHIGKDEETRMVSRIDIEIQLPPEFPEKYKKSLIKVAGKCTVKKHLENPPSFHIVTRK